MGKKFKNWLRTTVKLFIVAGLALALVIGQADQALAARSGGRIGGGSFRRSAPTRTYNTPRSTRAPGGGYGYGYGGGFGFPFLIPFFGFGGGFGGIFSILIVIALANFLVRTFQSVASGSGETSTGSSTVSVARVQIGLLAQARSLQTDLNRMAGSADTGTAAGRAQVLQEATLALLRHPEYWAYGAVQTETKGLDAAEAQFNRWALAERSNFTAETLSNVNSQKLSATSSQTNAIVATEESDAPGEYIVVTLVVGAAGRLQLPKVTSDEAMKQVISRLGAISGEQLLAVEILWTPQAEGDVLSADDVMTNYPDLQLI
ncbi:MAG: DUF1517 domain-containing protein [Microcoleaceae cyanobacterium]